LWSIIGVSIAQAIARAALLLLNSVWYAVTVFHLLGVSGLENNKLNKTRTQSVMSVPASRVPFDQAKRGKRRPEGGPQQSKRNDWRH